MRGRARWGRRGGSHSGAERDELDRSEVQWPDRIWQSSHRAIVDPTRAFAATVAVLVVACPCAFALAAPAAVTRTLAVLTGRGVLVVRPDALEALASVTHVLLDKTGR